jgi:bifunctional non-homologous end joining protein LigD
VSLETYRRKRDFAKTPEPSGEERPARRRSATRKQTASRPPTGDRRFVVQRHRATRLHYDFRLEIDGVLASWAVPKGPSLDPSQRRMAVHVEDHPLSYFDFEGIIPKGEYGGGDVIVWDWGTWEPEETSDPAAAVRDGELKVRLHGEKLRGRFTLVRVRSDDPDKDDWLLIHKKDDDADPDWDVDAHPRSVKSGRTNDEVLAGADAVWDGRAPAASASIDLVGAAPAPLPEFIEPMKATAVERPFTDPDWIFELKLDGYRVEAVVDGTNVRVWTRNRQDAARYFPDLTARPTWIRAETAVVDGEVVALNERGEPEFSLLQDRAGMRGFGARDGESRRKTAKPSQPAPIVYYVFDLLYLDGRSLLGVPLEERKKLLKSVLREHPIVRYGSHIETDGEAFHRIAAERGLEGIVAKERRSRYEPGKRSKAWLKMKIRREQELVVAGYEPGKGTHKELGSLIVGVYEGERLRFAGQVGSGLDAKTRAMFVRELDAHRLEEPPLEGAPRIKNAHWSEPRLVIRAEFAEWTADDLLRQAAYKGLEIGREPETVVRERAVAAAGAARAAEAASRAADRAATASDASDASAGGAADGDGAARPKTPSRARPAAAGARSGSDAPAARPSKRAGTSTVRATGASARRKAVPGDEPGPAQRASPDELAALEEIRREGTWEVGGHSIHVTNLDKVLFPDSGHTKRDLIRYYVSIAPAILPYLRGRALNLWRWPDGITGGHFWQKEIPKYAPAWMDRWAYPDAGSTEAHTYIVPDRVATLAWIANHATIDIHPWTSRTEAYQRPTYALIDIDPGEKTTWDEVLTFARLYRAALDHLGVKGFPKVTGKRGIQVWVPIKPIYTFDQTRGWVEEISRAIGRTLPDLVSWEWEKASRRGRARLDFTQNAVNKTLVAPYAVRPAPGAPVSAPISWDELDDPELRPNRWNIDSIFERLDERGDLFDEMLLLEQELPGA